MTSPAAIDIRDALRDARAYTFAVYSALPDEWWDAARVPYRATVNPPIWELAHIGWFQEYWCHRYQRQGLEGMVPPPALPAADALFDSRVVPHRARWTFDFPSRLAIEDYLATVLERTEAALTERGETGHYFEQLVLFHEDMHGEAMLMTLAQLELGTPPGVLTGPAEVSGAIEDWTFDGGEFIVGARPGGDTFVFDNEKSAHAIEVGPFAIASRVVSNNEFLEFVEAGGYLQDTHWSAAGCAWRQQHGRMHPAHWRRAASRWIQRHFDRWEVLPLQQPVQHLTFYEAEAFCHWAGRRLPSEFEWEFAARTCPEFFASAGQVWEWTSSAFLPYPGFTADPYAEYSQPWFSTHQVLRGGSFTTRRRLLRPTFRNFYTPERTDIFSGLRTCPL